LRIYGKADDWSYLADFAKKFEWPEKQVQVREPGKEEQ
jgi:hypothetical protein